MRDRADRRDFQSLSPGQIHQCDRERHGHERNRPVRALQLSEYEERERCKTEHERRRMHVLQVPCEMHKRAGEIAATTCDTEQQRQLTRGNDDAGADLETGQDGFRNEMHDRTPAHCPGAERDESDEEGGGACQSGIARRVAGGDHAERGGERQRNRRRRADRQLARRAEERVGDSGEEIAIESGLHRHSGQLRVRYGAGDRIGRQRAGEHVGACIASAVTLQPRQELQQAQRRNGIHRRGSVNANVEPAPTTLVTQIFPPWSSMNLREMARPSPVPSIFFDAVPTCRNSSNTVSRSPGAMPMPVSVTAIST